MVSNFIKSAPRTAFAKNTGMVPGRFTCMLSAVKSANSLNFTAKSSATMYVPVDFFSKIVDLTKSKSNLNHK